MDEINEIENTDTEDTKTSVWRKPVSEFTITDQLKVEGAALGIIAGATALYVGGAVAWDSWTARRQRKAEEAFQSNLKNIENAIDTKCEEK